MSRSIGWGLAAVLTASFVAAQQPRYNLDAPALAVDLLQAPSGAQATWESLKGQAVVLDFWSTWCTGCVAEIPRLNAIAEKLKDKPVRFIYITDEDAETVSRFLAKRPISGWVGLDTHGTTFRAFGVEGRPLTAFIDANGVLRGETNLELSESDIGKLLAGNLRMAPSAGSEIPTIGTEANAPRPLLEVLIRPAVSEAESGMSPGAMRQRGNVWEAWSLNLSRILSYSFSISQPRILVPVSYDTAATTSQLLFLTVARKAAKRCSRAALHLRFTSECRLRDARLTYSFFEDPRAPACRLRNTNMGVPWGRLSAWRNRPSGTPCSMKPDFTGNMTSFCLFPATRENFWAPFNG
jgi:thiol-disulfide isomerase/thioredoxin